MENMRRVVANVLTIVLLIVRSMVSVLNSLDIFAADKCLCRVLWAVEAEGSVIT